VADVVSVCTTLMSNPALVGKELFRIYYYDAPPYEGKVRNPISGAIVNYATTTQANQNKSLIDGLELEPDFAVRRGVLKHSGWKLSPPALQRITTASKAVPLNNALLQLAPGDLNPNLTQKGVDMRIGLDIAWIALKKLAETMVLVTGDSDLVPAMKFARKEGMRVYLAPLGATSIFRELKAHADRII
jgi:uncharacterized LabA/DUF88 family protein